MSYDHNRSKSYTGRLSNLMSFRIWSKLSCGNVSGSGSLQKRERHLSQSIIQKDEMLSYTGMSRARTDSDRIEGNH